MEPPSKRPRAAVGFSMAKPIQPEPGTPEYQACRRMCLGADSRGSGAGGLPQMCTLFQAGRCSKGVMCNLAHGVEELESSLMTQQSGTRLTKLCQHWSAGTCRRGADCWFAHGLDELDRGHRIRDDVKIVSARMDFSRPDENRSFMVSSEVKIPSDQAKVMMNDKTKAKFLEVAGPNEVQWNRDTNRVTFVGSERQVELACQIMKRVTTHCGWGIKQSKIDGLVKPRLDHKKARLTLAPMSHLLDEKILDLSEARAQISIGKDPSNDIVVKGPQVSRNHAVIEFIPGKGAVYIVDLSTNGTYLNGKRLPSEGKAKVVLWRGDMLLLQTDSELGYVVGIEMA